MTLIVKDLTVNYGADDILKDLSFETPTNEFIALLGPNGSGKTTLMKTMLGLLKHESGEVTYESIDLLKLSPKERAKWVSYMPQQSFKAFNYSVIDYVELGGVNISKDQRLKRAFDYLAVLQIEHLAHFSLLQLSGGQKQLVRLAQVLMQETPLILLDEPTNHLDYGYHLHFLQICQNLVQNDKTILMTTHHPQDVLNFCDRAVVINQHKLLVSDTVQKALTADVIEEIYHVPVELVQKGSTYPNQIIPKILKEIKNE